MSHDLKIVDITEENLDDEHICCAFNSRENAEGYRLKKELIARRLADGFRFKKFNIWGKAFIEFVPAEKAWAPVEAEGYTFIHCFWVSGKYKGKGLGRKLLSECEKESAGKNGLVALSTRKKMPFMTEKKFYEKQGFEVCDTADPYFVLMVKKFKDAPDPSFAARAKTGECPPSEGLTFYYSNMCPFIHNWVDKVEGFAAKHGLPVERRPVTTPGDARNCPSPFPIFSAYYKGKFWTHDIPPEKKFDKMVAELLK